MPERDFTLPPGVEVPELDEYEDAETQIFWRDEISRNIATKFVSKKPADNMRDALCRIVREQDKAIRGLTGNESCPDYKRPCHHDLEKTSSFDLPPGVEVPELERIAECEKYSSCFVCPHRGTCIYEADLVPLYVPIIAALCRVVREQDGENDDLAWCFNRAVQYIAAAACVTEEDVRSDILEKCKRSHRVREEGEDLVKEYIGSANHAVFDDVEPLRDEIEEQHRRVREEGE